MNAVKEVGKRIRTLRLARIGDQLTQEELAKKAGISVSFLSMIERGIRAPHLSTLSALSAALGVPLGELFAFDADPERVDALYKPLLEFCRKQSMAKRDVERLISVARSMFQA